MNNNHPRMLMLMALTVIGVSLFPTSLFAQPDVSLTFESIMGKRGFYERDIFTEPVNANPPTGFLSPTGLDFMGADHVIIADRGNLKMQSCVGTQCDWFGGDGAGGGQFSGRNFPTVFDLPHGVEVDRLGNFAVADEDNQLLQYCDLIGGCTVSGNTSNTGTGCGVHWCEPQDAAFDPNGLIWSLDSGNHRIKIVDPATMNQVRLFLEQGSTKGKVEYPRGIAIDADGNVIIADTGNHRIQVCHLEGVTLLASQLVCDIEFGSLGSGLGKFNTPVGVDVDALGRIWVADSMNHRIQVCNVDGECQAFGSFGDYAATDTSGSDTGALEFNEPHDIAVHPSGRVAVADTANHRIQFFSTESSFSINPGMNDAWFNPLTPGQGFFFTVLPTSGVVFMANFAWESDSPPGQQKSRAPLDSGTLANMATFGHDRHRWITAIGTYSGDTAVLEAELSFGGVFDSAEPAVQQTAAYGTYTVRFNDCSSGVIEYSFSSQGLQGTIPIERVASDNVALCEALQGQ